MFFIYHFVTWVVHWEESIFIISLGLEPPKNSGSCVPENHYLCGCLYLSDISKDFQKKVLLHLSKATP